MIEHGLSSRYGGTSTVLSSQSVGSTVQGLPGKGLGEALSGLGGKGTPIAGMLSRPSVVRPIRPTDKPGKPKTPSTYC